MRSYRKTFDIIAPAHWAPAIINRDYSGLTASDTKELNNWLNDSGLSFVDCLYCSESFVDTFAGFSCDVAIYAFAKTPALERNI